MADSVEAQRLKTLAEQEFASGNLISALKHAKHARTIDPDLPGLPELVAALKIIRASKKLPTPDHYKALQLEPFSHTNAIKKQYKKLALVLHPDKNSSAACEEAFKAVGEAMVVFSDKIRRKEYDVRLRISLQEATTVGDAVAVETFGAACGACGSLNKLERRYLGHILVCPRCKNNFKAVEADDDGDVDSGSGEDVNVEDGGEIRASVRIRGKVGVKRKVRSVEEVLERSVDEDNLSLNDLRSRMLAKESERGEESDEEEMTLSEMQMSARKKKKKKKKNNPEEAIRVGELTVKLNEESKNQEKEREDGGEETVSTKIKTYTRRGKNRKSSKLAVDLDPERGLALDVDNMDEIVVQNGTEEVNEKEKETEGLGEKRERRRVSRYGKNEERVKENGSQQDIQEMLIANESNNLEIIRVEESDFYDFDRDRKAKCFKSGQIWAIYDDVDGMPRNYALIHKVSAKPFFEVVLSWLISFERKTDVEDSSHQIPCGRFRVSERASISILKLFSHVVNCERVARELYGVYPHKGSVWALHKRDEEGKQSFDVVIALSGYSDVYGLSVARLVKAEGFRTVFKRREIGPKGVLLLGKGDFGIFSHRIPAREVSGVEGVNLPGRCWELDPASLFPELVS